MEASTYRTKANVDRKIILASVLAFVTYLCALLLVHKAFINLQVFCRVVSLKMYLLPKSWCYISEKRYFAAQPETLILRRD